MRQVSGDNLSAFNNHILRVSFSLSRPASVDISINDSLKNQSFVALCSGETKRVKNKNVNQNETGNFFLLFLNF